MRTLSAVLEVDAGTAPPPSHAARPEAAGGAPFDPEQFRAGVGDDPELLRELIGLFGEDSAKILADIDAGFGAGDSDGVHNGAHSMRGLVGTFAANEALELTERLDELAQAAELDAAGELLPPLRAELERLREALVEFAASLEP